MTEGAPRIELVYVEEIVPAVMPEKVVFLDIDGVLNNWAWLGRMREEERLSEDVAHFDPVCVARLNRITERTGAKIILSSSWRLMYRAPKMRGVLRDAGVAAEVVGFTPYPDNGEVSRYDEIARWLTVADYRGLYAILDDSVHESDGDFVVHTTLNHGLTDEHVEMACRFLVLT